MEDQPRYWQLPHITQWLPQESLYSLASRHHHISGNVMPGETGMQLFGHGRQSSMHDMPSRIDEFVTRTEGILGDAERVIRDHTLLPFYFPYRTSSDATNATAAVRHGGIGGLKGSLGILASRFGASHPLKACPQCVWEDQNIHPVAYWHVEHQWPGAWVCLKHQIALHYALFKVNGEGRFHWCLPLDVNLAPGVDAGWFKEARGIMTRLTECACGLGSLPKGVHFSPAGLVITYKRRLHDLNCYGPTERLKTQELLQLLSVICHPLSQVFGLGILSGRDVPLLSQFSRLVDEHRGVAHPLKHLVIAIALFGDWSTFLAAYEAADSKHDANEDQAHVAALANFDHVSANRQKTALVEAVKNGQSVTAASKSFGVTVATAMAWAGQAGICIPRRAKMFDPLRRQRAIVMLKEGRSKGDAAVAGGVSIQTITLLLRTEPALRTDWNRAKFQHIQRKSRATWKQTAKKLQPTSGHVLRKLQPTVFAWLYRNDRNWLETFNASLPGIPRTNNSNIRWDVRDTKFSQAVDAAALALHQVRPDGRIRLADLCNSVPSLKARLSDLYQLPLTRTAIARATRRRAVTD